MTTTPKKRKQMDALPYKKWHSADILRAVHLAGQGASAAEIARAIAGTTPDRVRAMLRSQGISLMRSRAGEDIFQIKWKVQDRRALEELADKLDRDPCLLAALIVRNAIVDNVVENLVDPLDTIGV